MFPELLEAREQDILVKLRAAIEFDGTLPKTEKFLYQIHFETRITNTTVTFDRAYETISLGYQWRPNVTFWLAQGEFQIIPRGASRFRFEHRTWQGIDWGMYNGDRVRLSSLTLFEERKFQDTSSWMLRPRQRLTLSFPNFFKNRYTPVFYEEVLMNANQPKNPVLSENRLYAGFSTLISEKTSLLAGYQNQRFFGNAQNSLNHNIYITFIVRP